jgi:hypothetical protein
LYGFTELYPYGYGLHSFVFTALFVYIFPFQCYNGDPSHHSLELHYLQANLNHQQPDYFFLGAKFLLWWGDFQMGSVHHLTIIGWEENGWEKNETETSKITVNFFGFTVVGPSSLVERCKFQTDRICIYMSDGSYLRIWKVVIGRTPVCQKHHMSSIKNLHEGI